jgi:hypothetical protein
VAETDVPLLQETAQATADLGSGRSTWDVLWEHNRGDLADNFFDLAEKLSHNPYLPDEDIRFLDDLKIGLAQDVNHLNDATFPVA